MPVADYRPWGLADWVFSRLNVTQWSFLGCVGTEERSLATWNTAIRQRNPATVRMLRITDLPSRYSARCANLLTDRSTAFIAGQGRATDIVDRSITDSLHLIKGTLDQFIAVAGTNVVLDVTSMPKRFFFPILRLLLRQPAGVLQNLVITYAVPERYTPERLAENVDEWECLPMFGGADARAQAKMLVVAVGFEGLGLHDHFDPRQSGHPIKLLLPFPAPAAAVKRSWELLRRLYKLRSPDLFEVHRVESRDVADTFSRLEALSRRNTLRMDLAPFGPKPTSLGMCLYAALRDSRVYYTQPSVYHPDYSIGVSSIRGQPEVYAYCIRLGGRDLFS